MLRVVFDTNVLLRMAAGGRRSLLNRAWQQQQFSLLMSLTTLVEFRTVTARPQVQRYVPALVSQAFLLLLETASVIVQPDLTAPTCRDANDTGLIATAVGGQADYLVTADRDLLDDPALIHALAARGVQVINTDAFLNLLHLH